MTIAEIRSAIKDELDAKALSFGENTTLTVVQNVAVTDGVAVVLETVNPNLDYPPTPRH